MSNAIALACNLLFMYVVYALCRVVFVVENWNVYKDKLFQNSWGDLIKGSLTFDTSAILYTNSLYALMMLLPFTFVTRAGWRKVAKWIFIVTNTICIAANTVDCVYFRYTGRRTTASVMKEFGNEDNLGSIFMTEFVNHWYLVLFVIAMAVALYFLYAHPRGQIILTHRKRYIAYWLVTLCCLVIYVPLCVWGMRGGMTTAVRPITISNANQYVNQPQEAAVILNTPFSIIRTWGKKPFAVPQYMDEAELERVYSPVHYPEAGVKANRKNVVVLIVESFGREYIGAYNEGLEEGNYKGYTPFTDSLYRHCLSFDYTFANGRKSIDGMPSILSSIPMFVEPFFLTPASLNKVSGIAGELGKIGYESAFFHGAENGSMGFQAFARATGFKKYHGRNEYDEDERFDGEKDFDGTWAIWDEPFMQYFALQMSEMQEPFVTALFTASSHHPFNVPEKYKDIFPEEGENPIHKCIRYTDMALRKFFETAKKQPWYEHTLFVLTSDHTNWIDHPEYGTALGLYGAPILFFDPSGELKAERRHCIAQQIDIMPTILGMVGYDQPYVAFGSDLTQTPDRRTWAVQYNNGIYQYEEDGYALMFDGENTKALYNYRKDRMLTEDLKEREAARTERMEKRLKAVIQSYMERMNVDELTYGDK